MSYRSIPDGYFDGIYSKTCDECEGHGHDKSEKYKEPWHREDCEECEGTGVIKYIGGR